MKKLSKVWLIVAGVIIIALAVYALSGSKKKEEISSLKREQIWSSRHLQLICPIHNPYSSLQEMILFHNV